MSSLPPEVEAELRRRAQAQSPSPPPGPQFELPSAPTVPTGGAGPGAPPHAEEHKPHPWRWLGSIGAALAVLFGKVKYLAFLGKFLIPLVKTGGTMLISVWVYAQRGGWWWAVGFVLSIFVHEMGHVFAAWRLGVPVSAPIFIPGFGALILHQRVNSVWKDAVIGIGGPVAGALAAVACLLAYMVTGSELMMSLAFTGALINLFNLLPIFPLDGGWITGAVSPRIWIIGAIVMLAGLLTGYIRNPFIIILLLLSLPRLWKGIRHGDITPEGQEPVTPKQRVIMGLSYVGLAGFLAWFMSFTHIEP
jgi:Zn-dependent protease